LLVLGRSLRAYSGMENNNEIHAKSIIETRSRIRNCYALIHEYGDIEKDPQLDDFHRDEILEEQAERLRSATHDALISLRIAYDLLRLTTSRNELDQEYEAVRNELGVIKYFDEFMGPYNVAIDLLSARLRALIPLIEVPSDTKNQRTTLSLMLRQIGKYFEETNYFPKKEKDVQDRLHQVLRLPFPDIVREPAAPKQSKAYHPDFGIASIATGIEVKFVYDAKKAASTLGSLYEDMKGYESSKYSHFSALIYMTGNFLTQEAVNAELQTVDAPVNWEVQVAVGPGRTVENTSKA